MSWNGHVIAEFVYLLLHKCCLEYQCVAWGQTTCLRWGCWYTVSLRYFWYISLKICVCLGSFCIENNVFVSCFQEIRLFLIEWDANWKFCRNGHPRRDLQTVGPMTVRWCVGAIGALGKSDQVWNYKAIHGPSYTSVRCSKSWSSSTWWNS